ncbi:hypothetical protein TeGR_g1762 [Tetraparma gracilis]|uniref:ADP/ATP translocase n=1 Tax=Tetraparma gracilis TaxID=2962635 RepID=A0ABQ6N775_9STRA|nr:hypothetical protein TeGR_g1762 [Tetraparma gracilis]
MRALSFPRCFECHIAHAEMSKIMIVFVAERIARSHSIMKYAMYSSFVASSYSCGFQRATFASMIGCPPPLKPRNFRLSEPSATPPTSSAATVSGQMRPCHARCARRLGVALFGSVLFRALHLGLYDFAKAELSPPGEPPSLSRRFCIAQAVSLAAGTSCYPLDSVRRRLMMQSGLPKSAYSTALDCARHVLREEGPRGFFLGLTPNLLRSVGGAVLLVSYDEFQKLLTP